MKRIISFLKRDVLLSIAGIVALISCFFVPPDNEYIGYINLPVLVLLFCLMVVVAGFKRAGVFELLQNKMSKRIKSEKVMIATLCIIYFLHQC